MHRRLLDTLLTLVTRERRGEVIDRSLMRSTTLVRCCSRQSLDYAARHAASALNSAMHDGGRLPVRHRRLEALTASL